MLDLLHPEASEKFCRALAERLGLAGYTDVEIFDYPGVRACWGEREVFFHLWKCGAQATVYLSPDSEKGLNLGYWDARKGPGVSHIDEMWDAFWQMEKENLKLGRPTWMHVSKLPPPPEPAGEKEEDLEEGGLEEVDVFTLFG